MWLFIAFLAVPLIEIGLFIQVGGLIGLWPTLLIVVLTAIAGTALVRGQGLQAVARLKRSMSELSDPSRALADGAMILFAGALLLTPGFFTDACGFALLVPAVRGRVFKLLKDRVKVASFEMGQPPHGAHPRQPGGYPGSHERPRDTVIDGDYQELGEGPAPTHPSGWTRH
ncbi:FxsA family protein [Limimaricola cinnabarinus]|uniref:Exlusion protein FxsA n=1 Tax=Limimaricola cinnabarinus TaxID=1125964 RepID=A0A2G1MHY6_9RHOB|nr:FxsA family protein [Limimaricola cinnabarinus]PHP28307.1 exlusion protein FxsA [Limimaricola cinnabarinus]